MQLFKILPIAALALGVLTVSAGAYDRDYDRDHRNRDRHDNVDVGIGVAGIGVNVSTGRRGNDYYRDHRGYRSGGTVIIQSGRRGYYYGNDVAVEVQRSLARRGYYRGGIDGDVGPGTRASIRAYQLDRGLAPTGRINNDLLVALRIR